MLKTLLLLLTLSLALFAFDKSYSNGKIMGKSSCSICSMSIKKFYKTSHAVVYNDGKKEHFCSMSCLAKVMKKRKDIKTTYVADASTGKLINAKSATYIIGSDVPSTMGAKNSKLAFASKSSAKAFQKKHGGNIGSFAIALKSK